MPRSARTTSTTRRTLRALSGSTGSPSGAARGSRPSARRSRQGDTDQIWAGRLALGPSEARDALNRSLPVDHRLWPQDVAASKAWVHALGRVGVVTSVEESQLLDGLDRVA